MKKITIFTFFFLLVFTYFSFLNQALATTTPGSVDRTDGSVKMEKLGNPLSVDTPQELIGQIINAILGIVGSLALLMFVFGGLTWMTSSGSPEKIKKGKDIIVWAAIGLAIVFSAYGLTRVLIIGIGG